MRQRIKINAPHSTPTLTAHCHKLICLLTYFFPLEMHKATEKLEEKFLSLLTIKLFPDLRIEWHMEIFNQIVRIF